MEIKQPKITHSDVMELINFVREIEHVRGRKPDKVFKLGNCGLLCKILIDRFQKNALSFISINNLHDGHYFTRIHNWVDCDKAESEKVRYLVENPYDKSSELQNKRVILPNEELVDCISGMYDLSKIYPEYWWQEETREFENCCNFAGVGSRKPPEIARMQRSRQLCKMFTAAKNGLREPIDIERELYNMNERNEKC